MEVLIHHSQKVLFMGHCGDPFGSVNVSCLDASREMFCVSVFQFTLVFCQAFVCSWSSLILSLQNNLHIPSPPLSWAVQLQTGIWAHLWCNQVGESRKWHQQHYWRLQRIPGWDGLLLNSYSTLVLRTCFTGLQIISLRSIKDDLHRSVRKGCDKSEWG